jgi:hypothetical protein
MTSGFGVDATVDGGGVVTSGTTAQDIRRIQGAQYPSSGIISGCAVTTSATLMRYTVASGTVAIKVATGETILCPVDGGNITAAAAPGSGTRTDIIYAQQRYPSVEGDSTVVIGVASTLPARAIALKKYIVSAGNTNTNQAVVTGGIDYALPYGSSLGILFQHQNVANGTFSVTSSAWGIGSIYVPVDRLLEVSILTNLSCNGASGWDNSKYIEVAFDFVFDGVKKWRWNTPGLHQAHATYFWSDTIIATAGTHTVGYDRFGSGGTGTPYHHYEGTALQGTKFIIKDLGPVA